VNEAPTLEEEIRIADQAIASAIARALGVRAEEKSFALLLAEINEADHTVHAALIGYLTAHHIVVRRQWLIEVGQVHDENDAQAKLRVAADLRDRHATDLRSSVARFRAAQTPPLDPVPWGED
jgi:hypothetical protein